MTDDEEKVKLFDNLRLMSASHTRTHDVHFIPTDAEEWHRELPWCSCQPQIVDENPMTGYRVYFHPSNIH